MSNSSTKEASKRIGQKLLPSPPLHLPLRCVLLKFSNSKFLTKSTWKREESEYCAEKWSRISKIRKCGLVKIFACRGTRSKHATND